MTSQPNSKASSEFEREVGRLTIIDISHEKLYCCFEEIVPVDQYLSGAPQISAPGDVPQEVVRGLEEVLGQYLQAATPLKAIEHREPEQEIMKKEMPECKVDYKKGEDSYIDHPNELTDFSCFPPPHLSTPWESINPEDEPESEAGNGLVPKSKDEDYKDKVSLGEIVNGQDCTEDEECSCDQIILPAYQKRDIFQIIFGDDC